MAKVVRSLIEQRAGNRCEYCHLPQSASETVLHVEHIIAEQHGHPASNEPTNLALACNRCNLHKGTNLSSLDPETLQVVPLFNPRTDIWSEHFMVIGAEIMGLTPSGRATARLLQINAATRAELRESLLALGTRFD